MARRWAVLPTAVFLAAGLVALAAPSAAADTPNCVSKAERDQIRLGWSKARVHAVTDTRGRAWDGHAGGYTRAYEPCWPTRKLLFLTYGAMDTPHRLVERGMGLP